MFKTLIGLILSLVVSPKHTGRAYFLGRLAPLGISVPPPLIDELIAVCIVDAKEKVRLAKLIGDIELGNWRANLVRDIDSMARSMMASLDGRDPPDIHVHPKAANDLLVANGLVRQPKRLKAKLGGIIRCDEGHENGFFLRDVADGERITADALELIAEHPPGDDLAYICHSCGAPVALCFKGRDHWSVRGDADWIV